MWVEDVNTTNYERERQWEFPLSSIIVEVILGLTEFDLLDEKPQGKLPNSILGTWVQNAPDHLASVKILAGAKLHPEEINQDTSVWFLPLKTPKLQVLRATLPNTWV